MNNLNIIILLINIKTLIINLKTLMINNKEKRWIFQSQKHSKANIYKHVWI